MTNLSRRDVLTGLAAAAALAAMPMAATVAADAPLPPLLPVEPAKGWWGYSRDGGDYWNGPFDSREEALAEAQSDYPDESCRTGRCIPREMQAPDFREYCVLWLNDGCTSRPLGWRLCDLIEGANEDSDYEGEVGDELSQANFAPLEADLLDVLAVALFRHGRPDLIPRIFQVKQDSPIVPDDMDPLLVALERDAQFDAELTASCEAWLVTQKLKQVPRTLDLEAEEHHDALEPEEV